MIQPLGLILFVLGVGSYAREHKGAGRRSAFNASIAMSLLGVVVVGFDQIEKVHFPGFAVELRQTLDEANATIAQLRRFAVPMARTTMKSAERIGYWDAKLSVAELERIRSELRLALKEMGIPDPEIDSAVSQAVDVSKK
jgi:hypothetical protein